MPCCREPCGLRAAALDTTPASSIVQLARAYGRGFPEGHAACDEDALRVGAASLGAYLAPTAELPSTWMPRPGGL